MTPPTKIRQANPNSAFPQFTDMSCMNYMYGYVSQRWMVQTPVMTISSQSKQKRIRGRLLIFAEGSLREEFLHGYSLYCLIVACQAWQTLKSLCCHCHFFVSLPLQRGQPFVVVAAEFAPVAVFLSSFSAKRKKIVQFNILSVNSHYTIFVIFNP